MKVYIAGKISGDPNYKEKFKRLSDKFTGAGHTVFNPAEHPDGLTKAEYMRLCFAEIDMSDVVVFMKDWRESPGAKLEMEYCEYTDKPYTEEKEQEVR